MLQLIIKGQDDNSHWQKVEKEILFPKPNMRKEGMEILAFSEIRNMDEVIVRQLVW